MPPHPILQLYEKVLGEGIIEMAVVLVACPFSSLTKSLLEAQLRDMQPVTGLSAVPQCLPYAKSLQYLSKCEPVQDYNWDNSPQEALLEALKGEGVTLVLVDEERMRQMIQLGKGTLMKIFALEGDPALAIVTATENWELHCWKGRVEAIRKSVLEAAQAQIEEGKSQILRAIKQKHADLIEELGVTMQAKIDDLESRIDAIAKCFTVPNQVQASSLSMKIEPFPLPTAPLSKPAAASRVSPESLSQNWQLLIQAIELSLGEQLSQEAVSVLTKYPDAERASEQELVSMLLCSL